MLAVGVGLTDLPVLGGGSNRPTFAVNFANGESAVSKYGFTFTRSGAVATYVNSAGLIATATADVPRYTYDPVTLAPLGILIEESRANLVTYSEQLDQSPWSRPSMLAFGSGSVVNATTAPDGTTTADLLVPTGTSGAKRFEVAITTTAASHTVSIYVKPAGYSKFGMRENTSSGKHATFTLTGNGTVIETTSATTATVAAVGNGWYRCTMTFTEVAATNTHAFYIMDSGYTSGAPSLYTYSGDGVSGAYVWGAQLELGAFPTSYIPTTSAAVTRGADTYSFTGAAGRTNLVTYSQDISGTGWSRTACNTTAYTNVVAAPDGTLTADELKEDGTTNVHRIFQSVTASAGAHTLSFYAKANTRTKIEAVINASGSARGFDLSNGTTFANTGGWTAADSYSITDAGGGWYRCTVTHNSITPTDFRLYLNNGTASTAYGGTDGYGVYIWGAQLETGSSATAYIATTNGPRTVENVASWFNGTEFTLVAHCSTQIADTPTSQFLFALGRPSSTYAVGLYRSSSEKVTVSTTINGSTTYAPEVSSSSMGIGAHKIAAALQSGSLAASLNGGAVKTAAQNIPEAFVDRVAIGRLESGSSFYFNGTISYLAYYPTRLSNATLQALTT